MVHTASLPVHAATAVMSEPLGLHGARHRATFKRAEREIQRRGVRLQAHRGAHEGACLELEQPRQQEAAQAPAG